MAVARAIPSPRLRHGHMALRVPRWSARCRVNQRRLRLPTKPSRPHHRLLAPSRDSFDRATTGRRAGGCCPLTAQGRERPSRPPCRMASASWWRGTCRAGRLSPRFPRSTGWTRTPSCPPTSAPAAAARASGPGSPSRSCCYSGKSRAGRIRCGRPTSPSSRARLTPPSSEYMQGEFESAEAEIINTNKDLFPATITFDDFLRAFGILKSRVFPELHGDKLALIPFADLIYIQYDLDKSNAELALDHGFIKSNPSRDSYTVTLEISESDPFYGDNLDIAELNGLGETVYFDIVADEPLPSQMLTCLRLLCIGETDAFLLEALSRNSIWGHLEQPVSPDNEESICQVMRDACKSALGAYHTTIQKDEELLETENLPSRLKIVIGVRAGEKKVLQQIDDIFKQREDDLDGLEYYQERRLKDLDLVGDNGEIIFWET